jgi:hypothetical protein
MAMHLGSVSAGRAQWSAWWHNSAHDICMTDSLKATFVNVSEITILTFSVPAVVLPLQLFLDLGKSIPNILSMDVDVQKTLGIYTRISLLYIDIVLLTQRTMSCFWPRLPGIRCATMKMSMLCDENANIIAVQVSSLATIVIHSIWRF